MLFEVYRDGKRIMWTEHEECIPPIDVIKSMKAAGHKVLLDGKVYKTTKEKKKESWWGKYDKKKVY